MRSFFIALALMVYLTTTARASVGVDNIRCGSSLVRVGESSADVARACGAPSQALQRFDVSQGGGRIPTIGRTVVNRRYVAGTVEDWIYPPASGQERRTLTFVGGILWGITLDVR